MRHLALIPTDDAAPPRPSRTLDDDALGELVGRVRRGDPWAADALVRALSPGALRLATRLLRHREDAEDVVQDALVDLLDGIPRLRDDARVGAYLRGAVVHRAMRRVRRRALLRRFGLDRSVDGPTLERGLVDGADPEVVALARAVDVALTTLPEAERFALVLHGLEGHTLDEVAELTGASLATVKRRIAAARARLAPFRPDEVRRG